MKSEPSLIIENLDFSYSDSSKPIVEIEGLTVTSGKISCLIGQSGIGKTTLLKLVSGILDTPPNGVIKKNIQTIGYVSQIPTLLPWSTVQDNIRLPLRLNSQRVPTMDTEIDYYLRAFDLYRSQDYFPAQLSGGMKQRVSIIRALITKPNLILFDEPFASLDYELKKKVMLEIDKYVSKNDAIAIFVTHDLDDATRFSDEINILSGKPASISETICFNTSRASRLYELPASESDVSKARTIIRSHSNTGHI